MGFYGYEVCLRLWGYTVMRFVYGYEVLRLCGFIVQIVGWYLSLP